MTKKHVMKTLIFNCLDWNKVKELKERLRESAIIADDVKFLKWKNHVVSELKAIENIENIVYCNHIKNLEDAE